MSQVVASPVASPPETQKPAAAAGNETSRIGELSKKLRDLPCKSSPGALAKPGWDEVFENLDDEIIIETVRSQMRVTPDANYGIGWYLPRLLELARKKPGQRKASGRFDLSRVDRSGDAEAQNNSIEQHGIEVTDETTAEF